jgi:hypothetical protein
MSRVKNVQVSNNLVSHSGSKDDTRKRGRGSGLWGSSSVLIEKINFYMPMDLEIWLSTYRL